MLGCIALMQQGDAVPTKGKHEEYVQIVKDAGLSNQQVQQLLALRQAHITNCGRLNYVRARLLESQKVCNIWHLANSMPAPV